MCPPFLRESCRQVTDDVFEFSPLRWIIEDDSVAAAAAAATGRGRASNGGFALTRILYYIYEPRLCCVPYSCAFGLFLRRCDISSADSEWFRWWRAVIGLLCFSNFSFGSNLLRAMTWMLLSLMQVTNIFRKYSAFLNRKWYRNWNGPSLAFQNKVSKRNVFLMICKEISFYAEEMSSCILI